jgi:prepilin-type N-terminal cleavage/methylation domain-containing protein
VKKLRNKNKAGFTLIELLVVIAIIGLLASVVLLALNSARAKSRDAKRLADVRQMASAFELFFNDKNSYPTVGYSAAAVILTTANATTAGLAPNYIGLMPTAPTPPDGSCVAGAGSNDYTYQVPAGNLVNSYTFTFCLGAATGGYPLGGHTLTQAGIQ